MSSSEFYDVMRLIYISVLYTVYSSEQPDLHEGVSEGGQRVGGLQPVCFWLYCHRCTHSTGELINRRHIP